MIRHSFKEGTGWSYGDWADVRPLVVLMMA